MSKKRRVLELLGLRDLQGLVESYELDVGDRRVTENLVDALASSKRAKLDDILVELPRATLKDICQQLGLDDSGREKAVLVERIVEGEAQQPTRRAKATRAEPLQMEMPTSGKLTVDQLEKYLWSAADILRGSIDSSDYKNFIFGLLFLKRLSDVFEDEAEKLIDAPAEKRRPEWPRAILLTRQRVRGT